MRKLIGFIMIWIAVGMLFMLILGSVWIGLILIALFVVAGYFLFSC